MRSGPLQGPLFGLAPDGVFRAPPITWRAVGSYPTFSPLPTVAAVCGRRPMALTERRYSFGGLFSVALSVGTPRGVLARVYLKESADSHRRLRVTRHRTLWCSDFPPQSRFRGTGAILRPSKTGQNIHRCILINKKHTPLNQDARPAGGKLTMRVS